MRNTDLNSLAVAVHANAKAKGFWDAPRNTGELFMLIISELGEALEAHRKGKFADWYKFDAYEGGHAFEAEDVRWAARFKYAIKDTFEDEIADVVIRILDYVGFRGDVRIDLVFYEKYGDFSVESDNVGEVLMWITGFLNDGYESVKSLAKPMSAQSHPVDVEAETKMLESQINAALILLCYVFSIIQRVLTRNVIIFNVNDVTIARLPSFPLNNCPPKWGFANDVRVITHAVGRTVVALSSSWLILFCKAVVAE